MNTHEHHSQPLAAIEDHAFKAGVPAEAIDAHVAETLQVPEEYLHAYRLVARAIDHHLHHDLRPEAPFARGPAEAIVHAQRLAETIGWGAAAVYRETDGEGHREVNTLASRTLAASLQLRTTLRDLVTQIERHGLVAEHDDGPGVGIDDG